MMSTVNFRIQVLLQYLFSENGSNQRVGNAQENFFLVVCVYQTMDMGTNHMKFVTLEMGNGQNGQMLKMGNVFQII